jgi:hypothetical protein
LAGCRGDRPEDKRCDDPPVPDLVLVALDREPDPEDERADRARDHEDVRGLRDPKVAERFGGPIDVAGHDPDDPEDHEGRDEREGGQDMQEEEPVVERHAGEKPTTSG